MNGADNNKNLIKPHLLFYGLCVYLYAGKIHSFASNSGWNHETIENKMVEEAT